MNQDITTDKSIGDIIRSAKNLSADQVESILNYQRQHGVKFGEAAVATGLAKREDVLWALSQQFQYHYTIQNVSPELQIANQPFSDQSESIRNLRTQLLSSVLAPGDARRPLAVVSPSIGDGKSYFCANLAVALSQLGGKTLLLDADMRTPRQQDIFNVNMSGGLSSVLSGRAQPNVFRPIDSLPSLYLLPVGVTPPNPLELAQGPVFGTLLNDLVTRFDYVIVDTPAAEHGADARVIASVCRSAMVVTRRGVTKMRDLDRLIQVIKKSTTQFAGVLINEHR